VEAPEILPPPPALGGMLIEPADREAATSYSAGGIAVPIEGRIGIDWPRALAARWMARFWPRLSPGSPRFFSA